MQRVDETSQKRSEFDANNITVTWEFTPEDLNFSLFGYFTSKDKNIGISRSQGNIFDFVHFSITLRSDFVDLVWFTRDYCTS